MGIDIVIPTHNEELYIGNLLSSLEKQTFTDFQIYLVDGKSTDKTLEAVKPFLKRLPLKIIKSPVANVSYQRNLGAKKGMAEKILFLDADVVLMPNFLEKLLAKVKNKDLANCWLTPLSKKRIDKILYKSYDILCMEIGKFFWPVGVGSDLYTTRKIFEALGGFDEKKLFWEDVDYIQRAIKIGAKYKILRKPKVYISVRRFDLLGRKEFLRETFKGTLYALKTKKIPDEKQMSYPMDLDYSKIN